MTFSELRDKCFLGKQEKIKKSGIIYRAERYLALYITFILLNIFPKISPNFVSVLNVALLIISLFINLLLFAVDPFWIYFIQLILMRISSMLDKVDGGIARYREHYTQRGIYYEILFHFYYPFALTFSTGVFLYVLTQNMLILISSIVFSILLTNYKMLGKLRHHIKYKVTLENHQDVLRDYNKNLFTGKKVFMKFLNYSVSMIYDFVWIWYLLILLVCLYDIRYGVWMYGLYIIFSIVYLLFQILLIYPRNSLFSREMIDK